MITPLAMVFGLGCHDHGMATVRRRVPVYYPPPPASPRIVHLTSIDPADAFARKRHALDRFLFGSDVAEVDRVGKPYGVATANGSLYVCDTQRRVVHVLDYDGRRRIRLGGSGPGRLITPVAVAADAHGRVYVADTGRGQVVVFSRAGEYEQAWSAPGDRAFRPADVACHAGRVYVLNAGNPADPVGASGPVIQSDRRPDRKAATVESDGSHPPFGAVEVYDPKTGELLRTIGDSVGDTTVWPSGLAVSDDDRVFVADAGVCRIQGFDANGSLSVVIGGAGDRAGLFARPRHLDFGPDGILYAVDAAFGRVQMFDREGRVLMTFGRGDTASVGDGRDPPSRKATDLVLPAGICIDRSLIPEFAKFVPDGFSTDYLIFVSDQAGAAPVRVYAFGRATTRGPGGGEDG